MMKRLTLASLTLLLIVLGSFGVASAQGVSESGNVVILRFDTLDVDQPVMDQFYTTLHGAVEGRPNLSLSSGGDISMDDLLVMAGCASPTAECLSMLSDFIDGDLLLFGSVQRSADVHMFSFRLFDFRTGAFANELADQTLRGDSAWLAEGIPAVVEHFFHGPTASLNLEIKGDDQALVRLNGTPSGTGSQMVENLPPGEMVIVVQSSDGAEEIQRVILRHAREAEVTFDLGGEELLVEAPKEVRDRSGSPSLLPGFALAGVGVAGLVLGLMGNSQLAAAESEANQLVGGRAAIEQSQLAYAQELQDRMNSAHTMRVAGLSVGAVGIAAGGALIFRALSAGSDDVATARKLDVDFGASADGISGGVRIGF